tara:strand:+ start:13845 stop:17447 length:3603 start_codon:yes stop_codon:yes gene_type:complete
MKLIRPIDLLKEKIETMTLLTQNSVLLRILCQALLLALPVTLLAQEKKTTVQQYVVIDDAADVYEGKQVVTRLKQGSTVWGFQENQGWLLIKIPGSSKKGWTQGTHLKVRQLDPQQAQQWKQQADSEAARVRKLASKKQYQSALNAARESVEKHRRLYGDEHPQTLNELIAVGWLTAMTGQPAEGRKQIDAAVATQEALFAPNSTALAGAYHLAARFALDIDQDYAVKNYQRLFDLYDKIYQAAPTENIRKHREIVTSLIRAGKNLLAQKYAEKTWNLVEENQLTNTETAFLVMSDQAAIAQRLNQSDEAARLYRKILKLPTDQISGQARGLTHNLLGQVLISQDKRREAATEWEQALPMYDQHYGTDHLGTATLLHDAGWNQFLLGEPTRGRTLLERALAIRAAQLPADNLQTALTHAQLGYICSQAGDHASALAHFRKGVEIAEAAGGTDSTTVASYYSALGFGLGAIGDPSATDYLERSVKLYQNSPQKYSMGAADAYRRLGEDLLHRGKLTEALPHLQRALKGFEQHNRQLHTAVTLSTIARVYLEQGQFEDALSNCEQALTIRTPIQGIRHQQVSQLRLLTAQIHQQRNELSQALSLAQEVSEITTQDLEAHPLTVQAYSDLAQYQYASSQIDAAFESSDQARRFSRRHIREQLPFLSDTHQLSYLNRKDRPSLHQALAMAWQQQAEAPFTKRSAEWLINGKATSHEALALQHRLHRIAAQTGRLEKLDAAITGIRAASASGIKVPRNSEINDRISRLKSELNLNEGQTLTGQAWVTHQSVQQALKPETVLIDFIRLQIPTELSDDQRKESRYVAWITSAGEEPVQIIDIGPAGHIDAQINAASKELQSSVALIVSQGEAKATEACSAALKQLSRKLWSPLPDSVKQARNIIISPDASLWLVPWTALPAQGELLIRSHQFRFVVSGRDLISSDETASANAPLIVADPDFETKVSAPVQSSASPAIETRGTANFKNFSPVPRLKFAAAEAASITPAIEQLCGRPPVVLTGKQATEQSVKAASSPEIMVLTTHGIFLPTDNDATASEFTFDSGSRSELNNPLLRSGLLFAGFNQSSTGSAGVLTGAEILETDLEHTDLVVMSACDTALGEINNGEGVAGLRQSFQLAGVNSVVASLWKIEDRQTAFLMKDFFEYLAAGKTKSEALRQAQLNRIQSRQERNGAAHPFFWAAFTLTGSD